MAIALFQGSLSAEMDPPSHACGAVSLGHLSFSFMEHHVLQMCFGLPFPLPHGSLMIVPSSPPQASGVVGACESSVKAWRGAGTGLGLGWVSGGSRHTPAYGVSTGAEEVGKAEEEGGYCGLAVGLRQQEKPGEAG